MNRRLLSIPLLLTLLLVGWGAPVEATTTHQVEVGDSWLALAWRYQVSVADLQAVNPHPNPFRQPTIGTSVQLPTDVTTERPGTIIRVQAGGLLETAVRAQMNPWQVAWQNGRDTPYAPLFDEPIVLSQSDEVARELPPNFTQLELSQEVVLPGQGIGWRGLLTSPITVTSRLRDWPMATFVHDTHAVAVTGTGAFYPPSEPDLMIEVAGHSAWIQPWLVVQRDDWTYQNLDLTGDAAAINADDIAAERARLFAIWNGATAVPHWTTPFDWPIRSYLEITSTFGARRSYNGGPYSTYHEGVDFSAYRGTPVYAPAAGVVVVAEPLYVRGGAVIIDHGLGVYSGVYHMSAVLATAGQTVAAGEQVGEVGTTGLSTGNHLHWDLLVNGVWVDGAAWLAQDMGCWVLTGWGAACGG